jgi:tetratricopeptide (TPR) repeat protein
MRTSVIARAMIGTTALTLAAAATAQKTVEIQDIKPIPAVPGESYLVTLDPERGYIIGADGQKYAARTFSFELMDKENLNCAYVTEIPASHRQYREDPTYTKAPRPGWRMTPGYPGQTDNVINNCSFFQTVKNAGKYEVTFVAASAGAKGALRVYFSNPNDTIAGDTSVAFLSNARAVDAAVLAGPASRGRPIFAAELPAGGREWVDSKPQPLRKFYSALLRDGEYNAVANFAKLGQAAIAAGEYTTAEWAFDQALDRIEAIYANDEAAKAARSKFSTEGIKDFKGDPYERAMAYYYRGLLYLRTGDYGNARASFVSAEYQDTLSEAEEFQSDFAVMNFLAGWSARCMGSDALATESFAAAAKIDPKLAEPAAGLNTLHIVETGMGPVKLMRGSGGQMVGLVRSVDFTPEDAKPTVRGVQLARAADINFQATTRGGRKFDAIMNGKVAFKDTMGTISDVAMTATSMLADQLGPVGSLVGLFGSLGSGALSDATKTQVDVRYWDTLPDTIFLGADKAAGKAAPAKPTAKSAAKGKGAAKGKPAAPEPVAPAGASVPLFAGGSAPAVTMSSTGNQRCTMTWAAERSPIDAKAGIPGTPQAAPQMRAKKQEAGARDKAFQKALMAGEI